METLKTSLHVSIYFHSVELERINIVDTVCWFDPNVKLAFGAPFSTPLLEVLSNTISAVILAVFMVFMVFIQTCRIF